ncbi:hypothetical protein I3760_03G119400 [Carya illinoinensis]|nr:hypothetical protein I3760_03G119400 [Carya illinoinensis]
MFSAVLGNPSGQEPTQQINSADNGANPGQPTKLPLDPYSDFSSTRDAGTLSNSRSTLFASLPCPVSASWLQAFTDLRSISFTSQVLAILDFSRF